MAVTAQAVSPKLLLPAVVESGAVVSWGAVVKRDAVVGERAAVGAGAVVRRNARVPAGARLSAGSVYGAGQKTALPPVIAPPAAPVAPVRDPEDLRVAQACEKLEAELRAMVGPTRREEGCLTYNLYRSAEAPSALLLHEVWASREAHTEHTHTPHFLRWNARKDALLASSDRNFWKQIV